jgi:hypothetical protein
MLVSLYKAKLHLRVSGDEEDALIDAYLTAAHAQVQLCLVE